MNQFFTDFSDFFQSSLVEDGFYTFQIENSGFGFFNQISQVFDSFFEFLIPFKIALGILVGSQSLIKRNHDRLVGIVVV
ncbi:Uncharacterised protein [Streptococcus pneumoniae]|nr:Uncharacterised protein [Streptococcus pneumoniae]